LKQLIPGDHTKAMLWTIYVCFFQKDELT
jgi:hypothetical protein